MHTMKQNFTIHCYDFYPIHKYCFQVAIIMEEMVKYFFGTQTVGQKKKIQHYS